MKTSKSLFVSRMASVLAMTCLPATAQKNDPDVGGAPMYPSKTIVQNAVNSPIHKTLVAAVKAAGLVDTLNSPGPFTVFAFCDRHLRPLPQQIVINAGEPH
jgi:uncharacterized surface protein with fasciclin (FAS1) repeats